MAARYTHKTSSAEPPVTKRPVTGRPVTKGPELNAADDPDTVGNIDVTEIRKQRRIQRQQGIQIQGEGNLVWGESM